MAKAKTTQKAQTSKPAKSASARGSKPAATARKQAAAKPVAVKAKTKAAKSNAAKPAAKPAPKSAPREATWTNAIKAALERRNQQPEYPGAGDDSWKQRPKAEEPKAFPRGKR